MRRTTAALVLATLIGSSVTLLASPAAAATPDASAEATSHSWVNERRASQGLRSLALDSRLAEAARRHAHRMADRGEVYHNSNLGNEVDGFRSLGENVGAGFSIEAINDAFWGSPGHRANIVASAFTHVGFGVVTREGEVYAVQVFGDEDKPNASTSSKPKSKSKTTSSSKSKSESSSKKSAKKSSGDASKDAKPAPRASSSPRASSPEPRPADPTPSASPSTTSSRATDDAPQTATEPQPAATEAAEPIPDPTPSGPAPEPTPSGPAPEPTPSGPAPQATPTGELADPVQGLDLSAAAAARSRTTLWLA